MAKNRKRQIESVAILGGGPVASTLATLLARAGLSVAILHRPRRAPLLVGESLVPAIIPSFQSLSPAFPTVQRSPVFAWKAGLMKRCRGP